MRVFFCRGGLKSGSKPQLNLSMEKRTGWGGSEMSPEQLVAIRAELKDLRKENKRLKMEREI